VTAITSPAELPRKTSSGINCSSLSELEMATSVRWAAAALIVVPASLCAAAAQIFEVRQYNGHDVTCAHSGIVRTKGLDCARLRVCTSVHWNC